MFAKAYALVAAGSPPLRRVYVKLPWPHLTNCRKAWPASSSSVIGRTTVTVAKKHCSSADKGARHHQPARPGGAHCERSRRHRSKHRRFPPRPRDRPAAVAVAPAGLAQPQYRPAGPKLYGHLRDLCVGSHGAAIVDTIPVWSSFLNYGPVAPDGGVMYTGGRPPGDRRRAGGPRNPGAGGHPERARVDELRALAGAS